MLIEELCAVLLIFFSEQRFLTQIAPEYDRLPVLNKLEAFERACAHTDGQDLNCVLWRSSTSAEDWIFRRTNYTHRYIYIYILIHKYIIHVQIKLNLLFHLYL